MAGRLLKPLKSVREAALFNHVWVFTTQANWISIVKVVDRDFPGLGGGTDKASEPHKCQSIAGVIVARFVDWLAAD